MTDTPPEKFSITYKDPITGKVWTSGIARGAAPKWVKEQIASGKAQDYFHPAPYVSKKDKEAKLDAQDPNAVKYFRYVGLRDEAGDDYTKYSTVSCRCIVGVIGDASNAIFTLNRTFKNEVSLSEFNAAWKRIDNDKVFLNNRVGVFTNDGKSTEWIERPIINKGKI